MTEYRARVEFSGPGAARHHAQATELTIRAVLTWEPDPAGGPAFIAQVPNLVDVELTEVTLGPVAGGGAGIPLRLTTGGRSTPSTTGQAAQFWFANFAANNAYADNVQACTRTFLTFGNGLPVPSPVVVLDGAALALFGGAPPGSTDAVIRYRQAFAGREISGRSFYSEQQASAFVNDSLTPPESPTDLTNFLRRLERRFANSAGVVTTASGVRINACGAALVLQAGALWITPSDLGNGADQIPLQVGANTAAKCENHPSVFFSPTAGAAVRTFEVLDVRRDGITEQAGAPILLRIDAAPAASRWLFVCSGTAIEAVLVHPQGSDLRRPRDVWNGLIVPALFSTATARGPLLYRDELVANVRNFSPIGALQDLTDLQYARFLEPLGPTDDETFDLVFQT